MEIIPDNELAVLDWLNRHKQSPENQKKPLVTLSYAQTLDGSLTIRRGRPTGLSGPQSQRLTHRLRASHDAILIGIGTVLSDDPQLTVRLVKGKNPQPIILDSRLRIPLECQLLRRQDCKAWVACAVTAEETRQRKLLQQGVDLIPLPRRGDRGLDLEKLMQELWQRGVESVMVEGGAKVLTSFLTERLADLAVITIVPRWLGGVNVISHQRASDQLPSLSPVRYEVFGRDVVVFGDLDWSER
jgi:riboflavin-specific deaminase-like protein